MSECLIHIDLFCALAEEVDSGKKPSGPRFGLTCPECRQPVQAVLAPTPHFEHLGRNAKCSLSSDAARVS